ncbi:MAG TPA: hypothetical protein VFJ58_02980 [Armatimonadota bacterium]|nr:hypothetical protein [Armatimonadota bacterium]
MTRLPIPFHDNEDIDELGAAAFLHVEAPSQNNAQRYGALLFLNARGEPLEFAYNRVELIGNALWRPADRAVAAVRRLAATLFQAVTLTPTLLLCRADTVPPYLFGPEGQIELQFPVGRVATAAEAVGYSPREAQVSLETADRDGELIQTHVFWTPEAPVDRAADLFTRISRRGLVLEPFERAGKGLREVYGDPLGTAP